MSSWVDVFYIFISGAAILFFVSGLLFTATMPGFDRWSRRFFLSYFSVLMLSCIVGFLELVFYYSRVPVSAMYLTLVLESLLMSLPLAMLTFYLLHCSGENMRSSRLLYSVLFLFGVHFVQLAVTPLTDVFFYIMPDGHLERGVWYPFILMPLVVIMLLNLAGTVQFRKRLSHKTFLSFLTAILPIMAALCMHMFLDVFPLIDISYVISALSMYSLILSDQIEHDLRHRQEIASQRANIMVL